MRLRLLTVVVACLTGPVAAPASTVAMSVSPAGTLVLSLDGRPVADGAWRLHPGSFLPSNRPDVFAPGPVVSATGAQPDPAHATVHEAHASVAVDYTYALVGEDLRVAAHVVNTDRTRGLDPFCFTGLTFHFNPAVPITGNLPGWYWTYLVQSGLQLYHPSVANQLGCWWAADDRFAFSAFSESEFDAVSMGTAVWAGHDGVIPAECQFQFMTGRSLPPGGAADVTVSIRLTGDRSLPHLLGGYKAVYDRHFPLPLQTPDDRLVGQFAGVFQESVTPANPHGYNGGWRRLDSAVGTAAYVDRVAPTLQRAGAVGIIFWSPGGYDPPMYPPEFDVLPASVQANLPALVRGFRDRGLRVGLAARPGDGLHRAAGSPPTIYRLSADDPGQMRVELDRFRHAMSWGFDMFYLDSFGAEGLNDVRILRLLRQAVGPDVLLYSEYCTDMTLPLAGRYCEWTRENAIRWDAPDIYHALRLLCPRSTWLCASEGTVPIPAAYGPLGLTPIVDDPVIVGRMPAWPPVRR